MNRISARGVAVASATAVTAVGAVVGVASGDPNPAPTADVAGSGSTLLAGVPSSGSARVVADNITRQSDAQQAAAAKKAAGEAARTKAAEKARARAAAAQRAKRQAAARAAAQQRATLVSYAPGSLQAMAAGIVGNQNQFACFSEIVTHESGWSYTATNPSTGAYGLVQALPGSKMSSTGADWRTNPATQIRWGLNYMNHRYGSPCGAWAYWQVHRSY